MKRLSPSTDSTSSPQVSSGFNGELKHQLSVKEEALFRKLNTPQKIQDFLDTLPMNFGETHYSPRLVLRKKKAHCFEGALLAAAVLWYHGQKPLLLDLKTASHVDDDDHVVTLFKQHGHWGAISKTNHGVLRYREPIYKNVRELAVSYFHEYYMDNGYKSLRSYSKPFDLSRSAAWVTAEKDLKPLADRLDRSKHFPILSRAMIASLRRADKVELKMTDVVEWKKK